MTSTPTFAGIIFNTRIGKGGSEGGEIATGKALAMTDKNATATPRNDVG